MSKNCVLCDNNAYTPAAYDNLCASCRTSLLWGKEAA